MDYKIESNQQSELKDRIQGVIGAKQWYRPSPPDTPDPMEFNWEESTRALADQLNQKVGLNLTQEQVVSCYENAFVQGGPVQCEITHEQGEITKQPLIKSLIDLAGKDNVYVWTVGDPAWQRKKAQCTGILEFIKDDHFKLAKRDRPQSLMPILVKLSDNDKAVVFVIDDKKNVTDQVKSMKDEAGAINIDMREFCLKLYDPLANPEACIQFLRSQIEEMRQADPTVRIVIVSDMDGVLIDTDGIGNQAAEKIAELQYIRKQDHR